LEPPSGVFREYTNFCNRIDFWIADKVCVAFDRADLSLYHPAGPDGTLALAFLRHFAEVQDEPKFVRHLFSPRTPSAELIVYHFVVRAAQALAETGNLLDACWVLDEARRRLPQVFYGGKGTLTQYNETDVLRDDSERRERSKGEAKQEYFTGESKADTLHFRKDCAMRRTPGVVSGGSISLCTRMV